MYSYHSWTAVLIRTPDGDTVPVQTSANYGCLLSNHCYNWNLLYTEYGWRQYALNASFNCY